MKCFSQYIPLSPRVHYGYQYRDIYRKRRYRSLRTTKVYTNLTPVQPTTGLFSCISRYAQTADRITDRQLMQSIEPQKARIQRLQSKDEDGTFWLKCSGDWTIDTLHDIPDTLNEIAIASRNISILWDVSDTGRVDSGGYAAFYSHLHFAKKKQLLHSSGWCDQ